MNEKVSQIYLEAVKCYCLNIHCQQIFKGDDRELHDC